MEPEEISNTKSVGRLSGSMEAKIVDPASGEALLPNHKGELWLRGPTIMKGEQCSVLLHHIQCFETLNIFGLGFTLVEDSSLKR